MEKKMNYKRYNKNIRIKNEKNQSGFTLIELIIVIAILGILAAILIPNFLGFIEKGKLGADIADVGNLNSVTSAYRALEPPEDRFKDINWSDTQLMELLVSQGYLSDVLVPRSKDATFEWHLDKNKWLLASTGNGMMGNVLTASQVKFGNPQNPTETPSGWWANQLSWYLGTNKNIIIPRAVDATIIVGIQQDAFSGKELTTLAFEQNSAITRINARAFKNNSLLEVVLPTSLKNLDTQAFYGNSISKITIGSNVLIETKAFANDDKFKTAYIEKGAGTYVLTGGNWVKQ